MHADFSEWLLKRCTPATTAARISNIKRIEESYQINLDECFTNGRIHETLKSLEYSTQDKLNNKPNPSKIQLKGDIKNNLAMYKSAANLYLSFLKDSDTQYIEDDDDDNKQYNLPKNDTKQKLSLERDMELSLRRNIENLDSSLTIVDDGIQRAVDSGFIDITCEDINGLVVIELKAGKADSRAIGQILGYMGDLQESESEKKVRGILIAHDFDKRATAAARVVPTLSIKKYSIEFKFDAVGKK